MQSAAEQPRRHGLHPIWTRSWRDGVPGLIRAGVLVGFKFYVWAELWRISNVGRAAGDEPVVRRIGAASELARHTLHLGGRLSAAARSVKHR